MAKLYKEWFTDELLGNMKCVYYGDKKNISITMVKALYILIFLNYYIFLKEGGKPFITFLCPST